MPSRELTRLSRLRIDTMNEDRLRTELTKAIETMGAEFKAVDAEKNDLAAKLRNVTAALAVQQRQADELNQKLVNEGREVARLKAETGRLEEALKAARETTGGTERINPDLLQKVQVVEFERSQALARLRATEALLEQVQKEQQVSRATQQVVPTTELFRTFAKDVAAAEVPEGFEIDDVEVEVRGALGTRNNEVVMGLDATKLSGAESATRVRFTLRRAATVRKLE